MSKTTLKKLLKELDRDQLAEVLLELYDARKDAREYLEYFVSPNENAMLEKYKAVILKEFFPAKGRARTRTSVCKKAIKEFTTLHPSPRLIADLKMHLVECIARYAVATRSWVKESVENTWRQTFDDALNYMYANDLLDESMERITKVLSTAKGLRGPLRHVLPEVYENFVSTVV